ncbi:hypothetical protein [Porphyrobacter sp. GA68]|uniref:hypothetical protein n=1 Tax=Porphyrobacter sp. GA68 TaxID=2883480 RepID=UPI001D18AB5C|nr:hypothetical protein [Porphyrobacter sp. GA68]
MPALIHFVGFRDPQRWANAERVFGPPDFTHADWDRHALGDIAPGDLIIHATGDWFDAPRSFSREAARSRAARQGTSTSMTGCVGQKEIPE